MANDPNQAFQQVRADIDKVDSRLVELVAERLRLTQQVGELKAELQLPLYVPEREIQLIEEKRELAKDAGFSPDLIEDLLRRIMRESYVSQSQSRSLVNKSNHKKVVVIGGKGQLGSLFVNLFTQSGFEVQVLDKQDWGKAADLFLDASLVLVAVPIAITTQVIQKLGSLSENCVLADITSVKESPVTEMLKIHKGPVVGLHPMFGPGIAHLAKQNIVICEGRAVGQEHWLIQQLKQWGANVTLVKPKAHDQMMGIIQVLRHFSTIAYGYHLKRENTDLAEILKVSSPIYRLELAMVGRLFAQDASLYSDIIFSNSDHIPLIRRFIERLNELVLLLESDNSEDFVSLFGDVSRWFGDYADQFLQESNRMLARAHESNS
jgi:chorismate mutase/prephenate dehydrogenase